MAQKTSRHHNNKAKKQSSASHDARLAEAALALAEKNGWHGVTLKEIAAKARMPVFTIAERYPHASDILRLVLNTLSLKVEETCAPHMGDNWRENLTEILMQRFDCANEYRTGYKSLFTLAYKDPLTAASFLPMLRETMTRMLTLSRIPLDEDLRPYAASLLGMFYMMMLKSWHDDDTKDLTQTMAAIDRGLGYFERTLGALDLIKAADAR
jgi:AcrR family transcriptional regulator